MAGVMILSAINSNRVHNPVRVLFTEKTIPIPIAFISILLDKQNLANFVHSFVNLVFKLSNMEDHYFTMATTNQ